MLPLEAGAVLSFKVLSQAVLKGKNKMQNLENVSSGIDCRIKLSQVDFSYCDIGAAWSKSMKTGGGVQDEGQEEG